MTIIPITPKYPYRKKAAAQLQEILDMDGKVGRYKGKLILLINGRYCDCGGFLTLWKFLCELGFLYEVKDGPYIVDKMIDLIWNRFSPFQELTQEDLGGAKEYEHSFTQRELNYIGKHYQL